MCFACRMIADLGHVRIWMAHEKTCTSINPPPHSNTYDKAIIKKNLKLRSHMLNRNDTNPIEDMVMSLITFDNVSAQRKLTS